MEQDFQTSFIPKKPMIEDRTVAPRPISLLTVIAIFIFFTMLVSSGALYFYKTVLQKNITQMASDLSLAQNRFEPAKISQLQVLDKRLKAATAVLSNHIAVSPIFQMLEDLTMKTVAYTKFNYQFGTTSAAPITINMSGIAVGYRSIALQADLFSTNPNMIDPVFSNLSLDDKGNVLFDLQFSVSPSFVNYEQLLNTQAAQADAAATQTPTVPVASLPVSPTSNTPSDTTGTSQTTATPPASTATSPVTSGTPASTPPGVGTGTTNSTNTN